MFFCPSGAIQIFTRCIWNVYMGDYCVVVCRGRKIQEAENNKMKKLLVWLETSSLILHNIFITSFNLDYKF